MIIPELIGRFHPLLVHLPIGIFTLLLIMEILGSLKRFSHLSESTHFILLSGIVSSVLSLLTGYILSFENANNQVLVDNHMWMAIVTTIGYGLYYWQKNRISHYPKLKWPVIGLLFISLIITGHQGGSLTHGEGFLQVSRQNNETQSWPVPVITELEKANVYSQMVQYTLNTKCVSCHGGEKQKGKLRLDDSKWLEAGGKSGKSINRNDPAASELLKRILLEEIHDEHMPPKGKPQLTAFEKTILQWWIETGASFEKTVEETGPDSVIMNSINAFKSAISNPSSPPKERKSISQVKSTVLEELAQAGWGVTPIAANSNYIRVTSHNLEMPVNKALEILKKAGTNIVELKLSGKAVNDTSLSMIAGFSNLESLWVDNNAITDNGFSKLSALQNLEFLNATGTQISPNALQALLATKSLKKVIAGHTNVSPSDLPKLKSVNPDLKIILQDTMVRYASDTIFTTKAN
ncbi:MAG: hypothetical protein RLZZ557_605 [Bacteroidota bacterium]